jgi:hypothetical protein
MIEGRHIDHAQLLQLGKVLVLLVEREELLVKVPVVDQLTKKILPIEDSVDHLETPRAGKVHLLGSPNGRQRNSMFPDSQQPEQRPS